MRHTSEWRTANSLSEAFRQRFQNPDHLAETGKIVSFRAEQASLVQF
jgi:hypothetical protein